MVPKELRDLYRLVESQVRLEEWERWRELPLTREFLRHLNRLELEYRYRTTTNAEKSLIDAARADGIREAIESLEQLVRRTTNAHHDEPEEG